MTPTVTGSEPTPVRPVRPVGWYLPWMFLAIAGLYLLSVSMRMNPSRFPFNLDEFARLPVVESGRVKPLESAARTYLRAISGREEFDDLNGRKQPAIRWYLDILAGGSQDHPGPAWKYKVIKIDNEQVLADLKLKPVEGLRYSLDELTPRYDVIVEKSAAAAKKRRAEIKLDLYETKILELADRIQLIINLNRFRGHDDHDNKLLLLPPQTAGGDWSSLGDFRDSAFVDAILVTMEAAQKRLADSHGLDNLTLEEQQAILDQIGMGKLPPGEQTELLQGILRRLRADPKKIPQEARREWLEIALSLLPKKEQATLRQGLEQAKEARLAANPAAVAWDNMIEAYRADKGDEFNQQLTAYRDTYLQHVSSTALDRVRLEVIYNRFAPFYHCIGLYALVFILSIIGFILSGAELPQWGAALRVSAIRLLALTFVVHASSLLVRMYLMDRPLVFVTNLYSSAIFIGLGCVMIGLVLEWIYPIGIGNVIASVLGLATTIVAHNLAGDDTLEMMQAVLDTNFWLATHVTTVTLGYTATFVAGFLGATYVYLMLAAVVRDSFRSSGPPSAGSLLAFGSAVVGLVAIPLFLAYFLILALARFEVIPSFLTDILLFLMIAAGGVYAVSLLFVRATTEGVDSHGHPVVGSVPPIAQPLAGVGLTPETAKTFSQMIYGILCFATLLSFVGTVLGGIWADQSWGRFWGWDPKENGAVLIVLWNALILHARWCGLVKVRGMAVLAVFGNMVATWSWFGTNQLGIGLHAYGFDTRLADGCANFWLSQLVILGFGLIPQQYWAASVTRPVRATPTSSRGSGSTTAAPNANGHTGKGKKSGRRR